MAKLFGLTPVKAYGLTPKKAYGIPFLTAYNKSYQPSTTGDNGYYYRWVDYTAAGSPMYSGSMGSSQPCDIWGRFPSIDIPAGAVVTSAYIRLRAAATNSSATAKVKIYFNDVDDASNPSTGYGSDYDSKALTTAYESWTYPSVSSGSAYDSPDITDVVQEILDRGGWSSGQDMMVMIKDDGSTAGVRRDWYAYGCGYEPYYPTLFVNYNA